MIFSNEQLEHKKNRLQISAITLFVNLFNKSRNQ